MGKIKVLFFVFVIVSVWWRQKNCISWRRAALTTWRVLVCCSNTKSLAMLQEGGKKKRCTCHSVYSRWNSWLLQSRSTCCRSWKAISLHPPGRVYLSQSDSDPRSVASTRCSSTVVLLWNYIPGILIHHVSCDPSAVGQLFTYSRWVSFQLN